MSPRPLSSGQTSVMTSRPDRLRADAQPGWFLQGTDVSMTTSFLRTGGLDGDSRGDNPGMTSGLVNVTVPATSFLSGDEGGASALPSTSAGPGGFWSSVDRRGEDECWEWSGRLHHNGYGDCKNGKRSCRAHRRAWELTHGSIPDGLVVCHKCDNRKCVNPNHLFVGTQKENRADAARKGRLRGYGSKVLKPEQAVAIKELYRSGGVTHKNLAERFGVSESHITNILNGRRWS